MSWIDKELRRRQKIVVKKREENSIAPAGPGAGNELERISALWGLFEQANNALPPELRLLRKTPSTNSFAPEHAVFSVLLQSHNGSGIGLTGVAIKYVWPKPGQKKSNNLWIRCQAETGYFLGRRVGGTIAEPNMDERVFNERAVEHIIECLVKARRVSWRSVSKRRFWIF